MDTNNQPLNKLAITDSVRDIESYLSTKGIELSDKNIVKYFFDGHDLTLVIYDAQKQQNNLLINVKDFTQQEDALIELNDIFKHVTKDTSAYHILRFARQVTDEVIGMLPTFQAFFGEKIEVVPSLGVNRYLIPTSQTQSIAA